MEELFEKFADAGEMWSNEADLDDNPLSKKYKTTGIYTSIIINLILASTVKHWQDFGKVDFCYGAD